MQERYFHFSTPPMPHYLISGDISNVPGDQHADRKAIGVFDLIVVCEGELYIGEDDMNWKVSEGQVLILRPESHHFPTKVCDKNTRYYWLHFQTNGDWKITNNAAPNLWNEHQSLADSYYQHYGNDYRLVVKQYSTLTYPELMYRELEKLMKLRTQTHTGNCLQQQSIFHNLLFRLHEEVRSHGQAGTEVAEKAAQYIRNHYQDSITLNDLQEELHFHPIYITRCMKKTYGYTPLDYTNRYRIETAKLQLMTTEKPITVIAAEVGFSAVPYFTRCFRKYSDTSPREYRKQFRVKPDQT